jgi:GAF domain-containing protein
MQVTAMIEQMIRYLAAPNFDNEQENRQASLVNIITLTQSVVAFFGMIAALSIGQGNLKVAVACGIFLLLAITSQLFLRLGKIQLSSILLISGSWIVTTLAVYSLGGISHPFVNVYFIILIIASLILSVRSAIVLSGLTILTMLALTVADQLGMITHMAVSLQEHWITDSSLLIFSAFLLYFGINNLSQALLRSYKNQASLAQSNRKLATVQTSLEEQITERTARLQQRSRYLEASIEIGRAASSILDSDELIQHVVDLIQNRFDLYYVGLFLIDPGAEWAVLKAGSGEAGKVMQARGHRIKRGSGVVGWSIANAQPRVTMIAKEDSIRLGTPELSETRSEAALPLRSRGEVIGALTVQSVRLHTFDEDMVLVLQTMADQVAIAIDNARLFSENQNALESARQAYGEISQQAWNELFKTRSQLGYRYTGKEIFPIEGEWQPELIQAAQTGRRLENNNEDSSSLTIPIKVRNQVVGALKFQKEGSGKKWTPEETSLLETLTEQLGVAVESARLYEETQRRAERERLAGEISAKLRASNDPQTILQTAVQELRQALQANRAQVLLQPHRSAEQAVDAGRNGHKAEHTLQATPNDSSFVPKKTES